MIDIQDLFGKCKCRKVKELSSCVFSKLYTLNKITVRNYNEDDVCGISFYSIGDEDVEMDIFNRRGKIEIFIRHLPVGGGIKEMFFKDINKAIEYFDSYNL